MTIRGLVRRYTGRRDFSRSGGWGGKPARLAASVLVIAGSLFVSTAATSAAPANAAGCGNYAPVKADVTGPWGKVGTVQLSYNPCNRNVWGYVVTGWQGLVAPAGLPVAIRDRLNAAVVATLKEWAVVERLQALGNEPHPSTPEEFRARMVADIAKWTAVVDNSNFERI